jgi:hypothetical protein
MKSTQWQTGRYPRQTSCQMLSLLASKIILTKCLLFSLLIIKSANANAKAIKQEGLIMNPQNSIHQTLESLILKLTAIHMAIFIILNMTLSLRHLLSHKVDNNIKKHNILTMLSSKCTLSITMIRSPS